MSKKRGRPPVASEIVAKILELRKSGWGYKRIANELKLGRSTVRRYINNSSDSDGGLFDRGKKGRVRGRSKQDRGA